MAHITVMDIRHEIQQRLDLVLERIDRMDEERETLRGLLDFIDEGMGFDIGIRIAQLGAPLSNGVPLDLREKILMDGDFDPADAQRKGF